VGLFLSFTFGLALWVALWATGVKAIDAMMLTLLIVLGAAIARIVAPFLPGNRAGD
jgi:hypothetical protein